MTEELFKLILSGGAGGVFSAFLFWLYLRSEKEAAHERELRDQDRERYILKLEAEAKELRDRLEYDERPTRPIRYKPAKHD